MVVYYSLMVLFCFCVLFSDIYPKFKFTAKNLSDLGYIYIYIVK